MGFWDRNRDRSDEDDRDNRRWRSGENRGQFGYEGEGYMSGRGRDIERDLQQRESERWDRNDFDRDREYGGRSDSTDSWRSTGRGDDRSQTYGRDAARSSYNTSFTGGGYGTANRLGGSGQGAYGGASGYGSRYNNESRDNRGGGSDAGYRGSGFMGGDYSGGSTNNRSYGGQSFPNDMPPRSGRSSYDYDESNWRDDRGRSFNDYGRGSMGLGGYGESLARQERQSFRGRGPKGYQRSDERIREDVCERLAQDDDVDATDLDVTVNGGIVSLSGRVSDRGQKRRAEDVVERIGGVKDVENNIRVERADHENGSIFGNRPGAATAAAAAAASHSTGSTGDVDLSSNAAGTTVTGTPTTTSNKSRAK